MIDDIAKPQRKPEVVQGKPSATPALSAIVVVPDAYETVRRTMGCLRAQTVAEQVEIVIVAPSRQQIGLDERDLACFHSWQVVEAGKVTSIGDGFEAGIRKARAPIVALTEDHSYPDANWAEAFISAHGQPWAVVGPRMRNGNPGTMISRADFYQAYGEWAQPVSSGTVRHLPGHNSSYKRDLLLEYDTALIDRLEAESVLHWDLGRRGYQLYLESQAVTRHLNFALFSTWFPLHFWSGRRFASTRGRGWPLWRCLLYVCASPLIPLVRFRRIFAEARKPGRYPGSLLRLAPVLLLGLLLDGFGQMLGYAFGPGDTMEKSAELELHIEKRVGVSPS